MRVYRGGVNLPAVIPLLLPAWLDPAVLIHALGNGALWGVAAILILECAIFPILPGDSLLFTVGMFIAMTPPSITFGTLPAWAVLLICLPILTAAAVLGNVIGYGVGARVGHVLFRPREGFWGKVFDPKYVTATHAFFDRHGPRALVLARFVPLIRTFVTLIAGASGMDRRTFIRWTAVGGVAWAVIITLGGFFLGRVPFIGENIDAVLVAIVAVSLLPMGVEWLRNRRRPASVRE